MDGRDWPNRAMSQFVSTTTVDWHVQVAGAGSGLLLLHGTGASTHTWRDMLAPLAERFTVIAPDLPGQGFSRARSVTSMSLPGMARAVSELLARLGMQPVGVVGHSAGAAIAAQMVLDRLMAPAHFIAINPAMLPLGGVAGQLFSPIARLFAGATLIPRLFSQFSSDRHSVRRLIDSTGSRLDEQGLALYQTLIASPAHVAGTLAMMANWDLHALAGALPRLRVNAHFILGANDRTISPASGHQVARLLGAPPRHVHVVAGCGHLVHEERPLDVVAQIIGIVDGERPRQVGGTDAINNKAPAETTGGEHHAN